MDNKQFKTLRAQLDLTQTEFGKLLGIGRVQVAKIESGKFNPSKSVILLAEALKAKYEQKAAIALIQS